MIVKLRTEKEIREEIIGTKEERAMNYKGSDASQRKEWTTKIKWLKWALGEKIHE